jgi:hypothetical protein
MDDTLLGRAVRNNAEWCDIVCRAHGSPGEFSDGMWINRGIVPRFYPNAQTLAAPGSRQIAAIEGLRHEKLAAGWAIKDSFASLDLGPLGFTLLFEAEWICRASEAREPAISPELRWEPVRTGDGLARWERAWCEANHDANPARVFLPALLDDPDVSIVAVLKGDRIVAGAIGNKSHGVVGWSNFFVEPSEDLHTCAAGSLAALERNFPGIPIVGYEGGQMLELARSLGFRSLGPLRVWVFKG